MLGIELSLNPYLDQLNAALRSVSPAAVEQLAEDLANAWFEGRTVFLCGNGGSGSTASHFCEDLGKGLIRPEDLDDRDARRMKVLSLTDNTSYILAWGNDEGFERIFVEQLRNFAAPGDLLIAISGSGNSPNVLRAVAWGNEHGLQTWGVTGFGGGRLCSLANRSLHVPLDDMGMVESVHLCLFHWVLNDVYARIHGVGRHAGCLAAAESQ